MARAINILTDSDTNPAKNIVETVSKNYNKTLIGEIAAGILVLLLVGLLIFLRRRKIKKAKSLG